MNDESCSAAVGGKNQMSGLQWSATWIVVNLTQRIDKSRAGVYWLYGILGDVGFDRRHALSKTRHKAGFDLNCGHPTREGSTASQALRALNTGASKFWGFAS